jgi:hypothetical protein
MNRKIVERLKREEKMLGKESTCGAIEPPHKNGPQGFFSLSPLEQNEVWFGDHISNHQQRVKKTGKEREKQVF